MAKLISYTCTHCGGVLNIDSDQEILDCPFCGTMVNLVEYHRKDILSQAELCLKRMEYNSAYERYKELYDKNPKDFEVLRGLVLCAGKIPVKNDLVYPKKLIRHDLYRAIAVLGQYAEDCSGYEYFEHLDTVFKLCIEYRELIKVREKNAKLTRIRIKNLANREYGNPDQDLKDIASCNKKNTDLLTPEINELERKLRLNCAKLKMTEPKPEEQVVYSSSINKAEVNPDSESISNINCIKCGGQLLMDAKRSLCECGFCGVAYGTSLFFGEPNKKAKEALVKQEFSEADQRYSYMLMLDPHNFEALRGRVLSAAKWSCVKVENDISNFWVNNLRSRVESALEKALDCDKPYFEKFIEMMDAYSLILAEDNKLKPLVRQRKDLLYRRDHIVVDYDPNEENKPALYAHKTISETIADTEKQIDMIKINRNKNVDKVREICNRIQEMDKKWLAEKAMTTNASHDIFQGILYMDLISNYMTDDSSRRMLNELTQKTFGFDFEGWVKGGYFEGDYIPYSFVKDGMMISNVSANKMHFLQRGIEKNYIQLGTVMTDEAYRKQGLAGKLIEHVIRTYENDCDGIYLFGNLGAVDFYLKNGFRMINQYRYFVKEEHIKKCAGSRFAPVKDMGEDIKNKYLQMVRNSYFISSFEQINKYGLQMFYTAGLDNVLYAEDIDCFAVIDDEDGLALQSVLCKEKIALTDVIGRLDLETTQLRLGFTPLDEDLYLCTAELYDGADDYRLFYRGGELEAIERDKLYFPDLSHA